MLLCCAYYYAGLLTPELTKTPDRQLQSLLSDNDGTGWKAQTGKRARW